MTDSQVPWALAPSAAWCLDRHGGMPELVTRVQGCEARRRAAPRALGHPLVTGPGSGVRCSPPASAAGCTTTTPPPAPMAARSDKVPCDGQALIATCGTRLIRVSLSVLIRSGQREHS